MSDDFFALFLFIGTAHVVMLEALLSLLFLRPASRWVLGSKIGYQRLRSWAGIQAVLIAGHVYSIEGWRWPPLIGFALVPTTQLLLGGAFFGRFAAASGKPAPGFLRATAMMGVDLVLALAASAVVLSILSFLTKLSFR